tara:strand:+ start:47894 stop:48139 length:246 start_codon:yes stop_codon:yes gene_type:complete
MSEHVINAESDLEALQTAETKLEFGDILVHKKIAFAKVEAWVAKYYPNIEIFSITPGTDLYSQYGYNCSVVISKESEMNAE